MLQRQRDIWINVNFCMVGGGSIVLYGWPPSLTVQTPSPRRNSSFNKCKFEAESTSGSQHHSWDIQSTPPVYFPMYMICAISLYFTNPPKTGWKWSRERSWQEDWQAPLFSTKAHISGSPSGWTDIFGRSQNDKQWWWWMQYTKYGRWESDVPLYIKQMMMMMITVIPLTLWHMQRNSPQLWWWYDHLSLAKASLNITTITRNIFIWIFPSVVVSIFIYFLHCIDIARKETETPQLHLSSILVMIADSRSNAGALMTNVIAYLKSDTLQYIS